MENENVAPTIQMKPEEQGVDPFPSRRRFALLEWGVVSLAAALLIAVIVGATMAVRLQNQNRDLRTNLRVSNPRGSVLTELAASCRASRWKVR
jgi:hypothetical protein